MVTMNAMLSVWTQAGSLSRHIGGTSALVLCTPHQMAHLWMIMTTGGPRSSTIPLGGRSCSGGMYQMDPNSPKTTPVETGLQKRVTKVIDLDLATSRLTESLNSFAETPTRRLPYMEPVRCMTATAEGRRMSRWTQPTTRHSWSCS